MSFSTVFSSSHNCFRHLCLLTGANLSHDSHIESARYIVLLSSSSSNSSGSELPVRGSSVGGEAPVSRPSACSEAPVSVSSLGTAPPIFTDLLVCISVQKSSYGIINEIDQTYTKMNWCIDTVFKKHLCS